jgi:hypothetical protein
MVLFLAVSAVILVPTSVEAQELEDVVYLKDGSVLRGTIVEQVPNESILIRTRDGNQFRIIWDRIDRMTKEPVAAAAPPPAGPTRPQVTTGRKSPGVAFLLSFLITGAGQGYNGQWGKAAIMFGGQVASLAIAVGAAEDCADFDDCGTFGAGIAGILVFGLWSWIDAPISASAINRRIDAGMALELGPRLDGRLASAAAIRGPLPQPTRYGISLARVSF